MEHLNILRTYLSQFDFLDSDDVLVFSELLQIRNFSPGEMVMKEGKVHTKLHMLFDGLVRAFQTRENGEERTLWIGGPGAHLADPSSLIGGNMSFVNFEVIESSVIASFDKDKMDQLMFIHPNLLRFKTISLEKLVWDLYERIHFLNMLNPLERFQFLMEQHPDYFKRIPQKHLASFIGVSEVHMSRLKKLHAGNK